MTHNQWEKEGAGFLQDRTLKKGENGRSREDWPGEDGRTGNRGLPSGCGGRTRRTLTEWAGRIAMSHTVYVVMRVWSWGSAMASLRVLQQRELVGEDKEAGRKEAVHLVGESHQSLGSVERQVGRATALKHGPGQGRLDVETHRSLTPESIPSTAHPKLAGGDKP